MPVTSNHGGTSSSNYIIGSSYLAPSADNHAAPKKYVDDSLTNTGGGDDINDAFIQAQANYYTERTYNSEGYITQKDTWSSSSKVTKLFTKTYTYNSDNYMTASVLTDEINTKTLTKAWTYNASNQVTNSTRAYT